MTKIKDVIQVLEQVAPLAYQESYDNSGLQTGDASASLSGVLLTLDCTPEVVEEAIRKNCNLIVSHHPVIFRPLKQLTGRNYVERTIIKAIQHNIAIYACHTNLDNVQNGVNAKIAQKLGLIHTRILSQKPQLLMKLVSFVPVENTDQVLENLHRAGAGQVGDYKNCSFRVGGKGRFLPTEEANPHIGKPGEAEEVEENRIEVIFPAYLQNKIIEALTAAHPYEEVAYYLTRLENINQEIGAGMIGELEQALPVEDFLKYVKQKMNLQVVKHTLTDKNEIKKVAVCGGAGSFLIKDALRQNADAYITGDLKHHEYFDAENRLLLTDIGHYESEVFTKELFYDLISKNFSNFAVCLSEINTNPVRYT